jgi:hypothetical protein
VETLPEEQLRSGTTASSFPSLNMLKSRLNSVQNLLSSRLIKELKIKIYKNVILPIVLYGRETLSLTLKEEYRLRVFENSVEDIWT